MVTIKSVSATCSSGVLRLHGLVSLIGRMGFGHQRQSLGPSERGAFAGAVERRFAPGIEQVKALLALAAQPLICDARISTSSIRLSSRPVWRMPLLKSSHFCIGAGAAAN